MIVAIPSNWELITVGVGSEAIMSGSGFPTELQGNKDGDYPFAKVGDISKIFRSQIKKIAHADHYVSEDVRLKIKAKIFPIGTIVFPKIGEALKGNYRVICGRDMLFDNNVMGIIPRKDVVDIDYLYHFLTTKDFGEFSVATTVPSVRRGDIESIPLPLPPTNEQKRIVDKIEQLFSNIDEGESLLKKVQQQLNVYRQSVLKAAVTGELTKDWREANKHRLEPGDALLKRILKARREQWNGRGQYKEPVAPDTSNLPELPDGWVWLTLDTVTAEIITGPFGSSLHKSDYIPNGTPVINPINIKNGKIFPDSTVAVSDETLANMERFKVRAGDVIFGRRGEMGRCAPVTHIEDGWLCGTGSLILRPTKVINVEYLVAVLTGLEVRAYLEAHCVGTTMKNLNQQVLLSITLAVPSVSEQSESVDRVNAIFSQIDALEQWCASEIARSATLRQSILKDAFSGKLVPQDPTDEPACELLKRIQAERPGTQKAPKQKSPSSTSTRRGRPRKIS